MKFFLPATFAFLLAYGQPDTLWTRVFDAGQSNDYGYMVQQTFDGGFIICCSAERMLSSDIYLIRIDEYGDTVWTSVFGADSVNHGYAVRQTPDSGYVIAGCGGSYMAPDIYLAKTDTGGNTLWTKHYTGFGDDRAKYLHHTYDGGYIITGYTAAMAGGPADLFLMHTNSQGDSSWFTVYGGAGDEQGQCVQQTPDSGYIVVGWTESYGAGESDFWISKHNSNGDTVWTKVYGDSLSEQGWSVCCTSDSSYVMVGMTESVGAGDADLWILKTDADGDTVWTKTYGGVYNDYGRSIEETHDGGYIIAGHTYSFGAGYYDMWLIRTDSLGDSLWSITLGGGGHDYCYSVQQTSDLGFIASGSTDSFGSINRDVFVVRLETEAGVVEKTISSERQSSIRYTTILSGPLQLPTDKSCKVFDVAGRQIGVEQLTPGIYFIEINDQITHKVVKIK